MARQQDFINSIKNIVIEENRKRGFPLFASVVIAMGCLETGYGASQMMLKANAIFGIKAGGSWRGKVYSAKTNEVYNSKTVTISATFRAYDSLSESIRDYFNLICNSSRYRGALHQNNWVECIEAIKRGGYATDPSYVSKIKQIVVNYNLEQYDSTESIKQEALEQLYSYEIGKVYTLQVNLNVRYEAGLNYGIKKYQELTPDGKKHATNKVNAVLKAGTRVTCKGVRVVDGNTWLQIPSGFICAIYNNKIYIK